MERERIGMQELRQNLSAYVRRVIAGETFEVTDHGRPVALLSPLAKASTALGRLVREGRVIPSKGDLLELGVPSGPKSTGGTDALQAQREDRGL